MAPVYIALGGIAAAVIAFFVGEMRGRVAGIKEGEARMQAAQTEATRGFLRESLKRLAVVTERREQDVAAAFHRQMELGLELRQIDERRRMELALATVPITSADLERWEAENQRLKESIGKMGEPLSPATSAKRPP